LEDSFRLLRFCPTTWSPNPSTSVFGRELSTLPGTHRSDGQETFLQKAAHQLAAGGWQRWCDSLEVECRANLNEPPAPAELCGLCLTKSNG